MHLIWRVAKVSALLAVAATRVAAQDNHRVAVDLGYPPALALLWHVNAKFDLRPDFTFLHVGGDVGNQTRLGFGASALFPLESSGSLTPYLGVRGGYTWFSEDNAPTEWDLAGIFGGRYAIDKRFGVSAETGIFYDHIKQSGTPFGGTQTILEPWGRVSALVYF